MRTLVVSDLHLGSRNGVDVLRQDGALARLLAALPGIERLILLGDTVELRHGPAGEALAMAMPVLEAIGAAVGPDAEVVLVPGNHDHAIAAPWLDYAAVALGLEARVRASTASPLAKQIAAGLGADRTLVSYPGVWIRDDVYAMHGHYSDVHTTLPMTERLIAGLMKHIGATVPEHDATAEDYERVLAPMYALIGAIVNRAPTERAVRSSGSGGRMYSLLTKRGPRPFNERALAIGFPLMLRCVVPIVGPLSADLSARAVSQSGIDAVAEVVRRLGIEAKHVIFGHTHRAGPLPGDDARDWLAPSGPRLHNAGNWVYETHFMRSPGPQSPYWPGGAMLVEESGAPQRLRLLEDWRPQA